MNFGRRDANIANDRYGYGKGRAMRRLKHPRKGVKMDKTITNVAALVLPEIIENDKDIHLEIDILLQNKTWFILKISQDIRFIHCKAGKADFYISRFLKISILTAIDSLMHSIVPTRRRKFGLSCVPTLNLQP